MTRTKALCAAGYEKNPDGTYSNEKVFPKWREKYPEVRALRLNTQKKKNVPRNILHHTLLPMSC